KLVATLKNDNLLWRLHAQRLLVERGKKDVVPQLVKLVEDPAVDEVGLNVASIHGLWTLDGLAALAEQRGPWNAALGALKHKSAAVRRSSVLVLGSVDAIKNGDGLGDADPHVRLATLLALSEWIPSPEGGRAVAQMLRQDKNTRDRWILDAATSAAARNDGYFLCFIADIKGIDDSRTLEVVAIVAEHLARGGPPDINLVISALAKAETSLAEVMLGGLAKGWPKETRVDAIRG